MSSYEELASLTSHFPELLIVRRFDRLSARVILSLQAELLHLEQQLNQYIELDRANPDVQKFLKSQGDMNKAIKEGYPVLQVKKMQQVEEKLKVYHETILRVSQVQQLSQALKRDKSTLWTWLCSPEGGKNFLKGVEADPWDPESPHVRSVSRDLSVLRAGPDRLDNWLFNSLSPIWHRTIGHRFRANVAKHLGLGPIWDHDMKTLHLAGNVLCVLLSALAPIVSIHALYWIPSSTGRLIAVSGFILLFAILMMSVSGCRRFEVFASTAAFAAVQVVFLQGLSGSINCS